MLTRTFALAGSLVAFGAATGCVFVNEAPPRDPFGDIAFTWSFDGERSCDFAGVDELDIVVLQNGVVVDIIERTPCVGSGLILEDYLEGFYEVEIDAFDRRSDLLYSGGFTLDVVGGRENDVGVVVLAPFGAQPARATGDLAFFWGFLYPTDSPTIDCQLAGVTEVDVFLEGPGGLEIQETFACNEEGALFQNLPAGRYEISLDGFGRYRNQDVHLYDLQVTATVRANVELDLGDLNLVRDDNNFSDIRPEWVLLGTTCQQEGIADVRITIERQGFGTAEDVTTVPCNAGNDLRRTFVPASYTVRLRGEGAAADWVARADIDLAPNTVAVVQTSLEPL